MKNRHRTFYAHMITMRTIKVPDWVLENLGVRSVRDYKAMKRSQLAAVEKAADEFLRGSAYTPVDGIKLLEMVRSMRELCSVRRWGR